MPSALLRSGLALALAAGAALPTPAAGPADPAELSAAERLVFTDKHLGNLAPPVGLRYRFMRSGSLAPGFEDDALIDVRPSGAGCCTVQGRFLSGERQMLRLPEIADAESNPVILYFLEHDIREMAHDTNRRDGGNYFRNRIRKTLVDEAQVQDTTVDFQGRKLPALEVTLTPYATDPARARYQRFAAKRYSFLLADGVPGGVYQLRTVLPGALAGDAPAQEDVLTLIGPVPAPIAPSSTPASQ